MKSMEIFLVQTRGERGGAHAGQGVHEEAQGVRGLKINRRMVKFQQ